MKGESHKKYTGKGKFLPPKRTSEYAQVTHGQPSRSGPSGKMLGPTKGNHDLPPNRTAGVSAGHGGGPHKAGGVSKR